MILKSLLGGGAAVTAVALLSASLFFNASPTLAEPLAQQAARSQETSIRHQQLSSEVATTTSTVVSTDADMSAATVVSADTNADVNTASKVATESVAVVKNAAATTAATVTAPLSFVATAYNLRGKTASGKYVARGIIAADRTVLPLGTRVRLEAGAYSGEYLVADTGGAVRGRKIDIWMPSGSEAMRFGRRAVKLTVLTYGRRATARARH